jgi:hypothetical protein
MIIYEYQGGLYSLSNFLYSIVVLTLFYIYNDIISILPRVKRLCDQSDVLNVYNVAFICVCVIFLLPCVNDVVFLILT